MLFLHWKGLYVRLAQFVLGLDFMNENKVFSSWNVQTANITTLPSFTQS